jgi:hypothetical protein
MQSKEFTRSKARVDSALKKVGSKLIAQEPLRIHIPERFAERGLAEIEDVSYILGFMAIITEDNYYASSTLTAMIRTEPDRIGKVVVDDVAYIELFYEKGSAVIASTDVVVNDNLPHRIYTEMLGKGRIPWYYGYEDIPKMFVDTKKYNGVTIGADFAVWEYISAALCRDPADPSKYFRQRPNAKKDTETLTPLYIPLRNVSVGATNVTAKLGGSYTNDGITAALVNPSDRPEKIETLLRQ